MKRIITISVLGLLLLAGCSSKSVSIPIQTGKNSYMATASAAMYLEPWEQANLINDNNVFCKNQGLNFMLDRTEKRIGKYEKPVYMEIYFKCVTNAEYSSVNLTKDADVKVEIK